MFIFSKTAELSHSADAFSENFGIGKASVLKNGPENQKSAPETPAFMCVSPCFSPGCLPAPAFFAESAPFPPGFLPAPALPGFHLKNGIS